MAQSQPASVPPASVPPATSAAPVAATTASTIYAPVAGPVYVPLGRRAYGYTEPYHGGPVPPNARVEDRRRKGAFAFGMIFASIGISAAIFQSAILASAHDYYSSCQTYDAQGYCVDYTYTQDPCAQSWWVSMLPIAGPVLSPWITHSGHDGYCNSSISQAWVVAPIAAVFELGGLLLAIYGRTTYPVLEYNHGTATRRQDRSPRFTVLPFAQGADVGITLGVTHF